MKIPFKHNDGGRSKYFKSSAGDCVTRSIAIAFDLDYKDVYDLLSEEQSNFFEKTRSKKINKKNSSARNGVYKEVYKKILNEWAEWKALMSIGSGCQVHVHPEELPKTGTYILRLSSHLTVWKDGVLNDTHDCSRNGKRCVYGYWKVK